MPEQDLEEVLTFIEDAIEQNVEQLSEGGSDRMFQHLSIVFHNLFLLLGRAQTPFQADELVHFHQLHVSRVNGTAERCISVVLHVQMLHMIRDQYRFIC